MTEGLSGRNVYEYSGSRNIPMLLIKLYCIPHAAEGATGLLWFREGGTNVFADVKYYF